MNDLYKDLSVKFEVEEANLQIIKTAIRTTTIEKVNKIDKLSLADEEEEVEEEEEEEGEGEEEEGEEEEEETREEIEEKTRYKQRKH